MFKITDGKKEIQYFPIFSETVGRSMLKSWDMSIPKKKSIFTGVNNGIGGTHGGGDSGKGVTQDKENLKLRNLILFARSLMILHIDEPKPLDGMLSKLYIKLEEHPYWKIRESEIKAVNTAIGNFLKRDINTENENFQNLKDYIIYLEDSLNDKKLRNHNFDTLRSLFSATYPAEPVYF